MLPGTQDAGSEELGPAGLLLWAGSPTLSLPLSLPAQPTTSPNPQPLTFRASWGAVVGLWGANWGTELRGFTSFKRKSPVTRSWRSQGQGWEAWVGPSGPQHTPAALTWAPLMSLVEGLGASGLGSSESEARPGLKQRGQAELSTKRGNPGDRGGAGDSFSAA